MDPRLFLREEELDNGIALLLASERAIAAALRRGQEETGLNMPALRLLITIRYEPNRTVSELRELTGATTPTMARLLGELDKRELIRKTPGGRDARRRRLSVSEQGEQVLNPVVSELRSAMREAFREAGATSVAGNRAVLEALTR
ncbi:MarR family winged helix-turn-helix transcriptional regulator [Henriciella aquimarina]|uniref:MarR family winged helix-turn-helix transcriptional regulator n=1 Tax=Henriciella aquimarina TaxID=545261 RepID=UPI00117AE5FD|nr:MarR family transcriptional regulator [Henriciella aquimarina]